MNFDLSIINPYDFGYICWINDNDISYSLTYSGTTESEGYLKFNIDGKENLLTIPLANSSMGNRRWQPISLNFYSDTDSIIIQVSDKTYRTKGISISQKIQPQIVFGKHETAIDVPEIAIRNLSVADKNQTFSFIFNEESGSKVHDQKGKVIGTVDNPNWLINESYHWKLRYRCDLAKMAAVNYDAKMERMVILNADSLMLFDFESNSITANRYINDLNVPIRLGTSFIDQEKNRIYVYELNDIPGGMATISSLNLDSLKWKIHSYKQLPQQRHHHNGFFNQEAQTFMIFGGFGNQKFSNEFNVYNIETDSWELSSFTGDKISPRFFSGSTLRDRNEILIFGGTGNESGDQTLGKTYYFDLHSINLNDNSIRKVRNYESREKDIVSVRNMIMADDGESFYTLCYPEYIPNSHLQLYQFSLNDGQYRILGDSIPIVSEKIESNANLYSNKSTNEIYCTIQELQEDGSCILYLYSLVNPPVSRESFFSENKANNSKWSVWILIPVVIVILVLTGIIVRRNKGKKSSKLVSYQREIVSENIDHEKSQLKRRQNALYLFGELTVYDKNGTDISYLFSRKIKQLFILIFINSIKGNGVTSDQIYSDIWPEKPINKAKNSKGVTLNQIRGILTDIDGLELSYAKKHFKLEITDPFYCDYLTFNQLFTDQLQEDFKNEERVEKIINILAAGPLLKFAVIEPLDKFRSSFENLIIKIIPDQLENYLMKKNYAQVKNLTKILYNIDSLNELAFQYEILSLIKLNMHEQAKKRYNSFIVSYRTENNDDFPYTFADISDKKPFLKSTKAE